MNKRFRINPKYEQGDSIRQNLRRENLRRSYGLSTSYAEAIPNASQNVYRQSDTGISNEFYPTVGEDGRIINENESYGESIFSGPLHFLFGNYENAGERWDAASLQDSYRLWQEKRLQAEMTNRLNQVNEAKDNLNVLDEAENYAQMLDNRSAFLEQYRLALGSGDTERAMKMKDAYIQNEKNIIDFQNKIKTSGKKNDTNAQLFFDTDSAKSKEYFNAFAENFGPDPNIQGAWYNPMTGLEEFTSTVGNIAASTQQGIDKLLHIRYSKDKGLYNTADGNYMRRAIRQSLENDHWTDPMFKDYDRDNLNGNGGNTEELRSKVKSMRDYWTREYNERVQAEKETANKYKNGAWYFDPQKINPKFRYYSENNDAGILGGLLPDQLLYSIAETGSSYSDFVNMGAMMASDAAAGLLANRLATYAVKRSPYVAALQVVNDYRKLQAAGKAEEAARFAKIANVAQKERFIENTAKGVNLIDTALKLGTTASNMFFINRMREHETNSEVIDAWSSRVLTNAMQRNADIPKVLEKTKEYLQEIGIDPTNMSDMDLVQHTVAYDIDTEDKTFEEEKKAGRQGLKKVYNDNMALAVKDYMEAIPFLGYSGSFLRSFGKGTVNKLAEQTYQSQARTLFDRTISKLGSGGLNNIGSKLAAKHSIEYLSRIAKKLGYIGSLEAIEEGQQELLQSRYSRGLYDQYSQEQSILPMSSILEDVRLSTDAVAAYMGILSGDPDNGAHQLRRAMQIGGITGMLMGGGAFQAVSNIFPSDGKDNLRNLFAQVKNDRVMDILVGDHYGVAQDDQHLGIFYDALQKNGISINRLRNSVEDLKVFKGNQVTDDYIDRDIELLNNLYYIQEHPLFNEKIKEKGYQVGSEQHKQAVIQTARKFTQLRDASKLIEQDNGELSQMKNSVHKEIMNRIENPVPEAMDPEYDNLIDMIWNSFQNYKKKRAEGKKRLQDEYDKLQKNENTQDWQLHKAKEDIDKYNAEREYSYEEYVDQYLNHLYSSRFVINSEDLLQRLKDRVTLLNEISKELGIDVSTSRLTSMISSIEKTKDEMLKLFDDDMSKVMNEAIEELNKKAKPGQKKIPLIQNASIRLERQYGKLPIQEEVDRIHRRMILNRSVYDSIEPVANAFLRGKIDPRVALQSVNRFTWKQLSKEEQDLFLKQTNANREKDGKKPLTSKGIIFEYNKQQADKLKALKNLADQYTKHLHEHTEQDDTVSETDIDAESMQKEAADLLFDYEMQYHDELKRVNHREYLRESASPTEIRDAAENNNTDAIDVQNQDFDVAVQTLEGQNTDSAEATNNSGENTDEIVDYAAENTDSIQDFEGENTDSPEEKKPNKRTVMSDDERALRERLGMIDEDTEGTPDSSEYDNTDELDEEGEEDSEDVDESINNEGENTDAEQTSDSSNTDAEHDLAAQNTDSLPEEDDFFGERNERFISTPDQIYNDFLGQTFKYDPGSTTTPDWVAGIKEDEHTIVPIKFKNGGKLKSPSELAEKLIIPGWFEKADKYFVITADKTSVVDVKDPDNLVVALIIQDGKDCYATFLTGLAKRKKGYTKNEEKDLRDRMDRMFWSSFKYNGETYVVKDSETGDIDMAAVDLGKFISRRSAYLQEHMDVDPTTINDDKEGRSIVNTWYLGLDIKNRNRVDLLTRSFLSGGRPVHSNEHIDAQISNLRNTRNQIINALLDKDAEGNYVLKADPSEYKEGSPLNPRISDGKINDQRDGVDYVFRSLLDGGFGMSSDLEELTKQIENEEVRLGVGRGERAFKGSEYKIDKIDPDSQGRYDDAGKGRAGKIYFIAETVSGKDRGIMLAERKFKNGSEDVDPNSIQLAFNPNGTLKENAVPSIAEFILYLISDRIDNSVFAGISPRYISALKEALIGDEQNEGNGLIVNHGKRTWVEYKEEKKQSHFAKKQFFINEEKGTVIIALDDKYGTPRSAEFDISNGKNSIFLDETQRKIVIAAIANNLHWNTPWRLMMENLDAGILEALRDYFTKNPSATEYKIAGIDDLTFKKSDLFNDDMSNKNVSLIAWLLGTNKLMTTVGDSIFYAPFVYCDGVKEQSPAKNAVKKVEQEVKNKKKLQRKSTKPDNGSQPTIESIQSRLSKFDSERIGNVLHITEKQQSGDVKAYALFDVDAGTIEKPASEEDITNKLKDSVNRFVQYVKDKHNIDIKEEDIEMPDPADYDAVSSGQALFTASLLPDGKAIVITESIDDIMSLVQDEGYTVQGVFSEEPGEGTLDIDRARKWIKETLGLNDAQVIVTNAVLKSISNKTVYGVMTVMNNILTDVVEGTFFLPKYGGSTIHYHEAFHYVNLLLHSRRKRQQIYEEYVKKHPEYKDFSKRRIEELLADDFAEYCNSLYEYEESLANKNVFSRWAIKLFNRFIEFIRQFGKKDQIKLLFDSIVKGDYKNQIIDQESLEDFQKAYNGEAYKKFQAEGATEEQIDNFKTISTYQQFYAVAENVAHGFIDFMNIKKAENVSNINQKAFERYLNKIRINNLRKKNPFVQDVVENPAAFINTVNALLKQYGIVGKNRKKNVENTTNGEGQLNEQNRSDDSIAQLSQLYDNYIIDQKTNVAYRAKLFLTQIRDVKFEYNQELGKNEVVQKSDPETGLPLYVSFDDAWQIITKELHEVDSFEELMSEVQRLAKTKAFFSELYKNLSSIGNDIQLQTQIYSTVNKHLTKVLQLQIASERNKISKSKQYLDSIAGMDVDVSRKLTQKYDQERTFEIINDNRIKARRMLPRDWSTDFFSSAAVKYDEFYHIDKDYVKNVIRKNFDEIRSIISNARHGNSKIKEEAFEKAFPKIIQLLNDMSIPFDDDVLTEYLMMHVPTPRGKKKNDKQNHDGVGIDQLFAAMDEIMQDPKATKDKSANIAFFVNTVFNATHTPQIKVRKKNTAGLNIKGYSSAKQIDEIYSGFGGEMEKMAIAYNNIHPSSRELSVTGPGGKLIYPVGENNFISDVTRWINKNYGDFVNKLSETTYAHNSKILDVARFIIRNGKQGDFEFKLNVYVGMEDEKLKKGVDYFGINAMEDVISKMLLSNNNMIVLPTMADKKTYYVLELVSRKGESTSNVFNLPHDLLIERESAMFPGMKAQRFSDETLDLFVDYFLDELYSLEEYYDKDNIAAIVKNKDIRKNNFHGKVKNGRMDFSGNGGKFRYFYGLEFPGLPGEELNGLNLNQLLEYEYNMQKEAEDPTSGDGNWYYRRNSEQMDGFESVRTRLEQIRDYFIEDRNGIDTPRPQLFDAINSMLMRRVYDNMNKFSKPGITQIIKRQSYKDNSDPNSIEEWHWSNRAIPNQLVSEYAERFKTVGIEPETQKAIKISSATAYSRNDKSDALVLSVIGNYTVQSIISVMEIEKVYSGDPAFYKWKYAKSSEHTVVNEQAVDLQILTDKDSDKIKRLGGLLSPGAELRTDFSAEEYERFPWLKGSKYVNATIKDVIADSLYFNEIKDIFTRQLVADQLRNAGVDKRRIDEVYINNDAFKKEFDALSDDIKQDVLYQANEQAKPYVGINVTDAQVLIRPDMYRKIRMMLGTWSVIPQKITYKTYTGETMTTTYSDNEAFEILENDGEWMLDPEKAAKVSRLQLYPLKMSYFKNDPRALRGSSYNLAYSVYNKMAIFPAFKYIMRSETGQKLYNRMNDKSKGVLDMVTVESAVKVGMSQDAYQAYKKNTTSLSKLDDSLDKPSACILENDVEKWNDDGVLNVEVQDIRGLRMQLNTEAHLDDERNIGTQMFKILFGNLYDEEDYTGGDPNGEKRKGKEIRRDIMDCINALTDIGIKQLKNKFYGEDGKIDSKKVHKYFKQIAENNGLPNSVIELLNTSGTVESLMQRVLFEHSVSSLVNSYVIDIPTKGGSAVQQSIFGTVSYDSNQIRTQAEEIEGYWTPNDGKELNWNEKDGTMEVMLSLNFFKSVVPLEYQKTPKMMRNWLISHNIIKGWKAPDENGNREFSEGMVFGVGYRIPTQGMSSTFAFRVADVLPEQDGDVIIVPREFTAQTGSDFDVDKIYLATMSFKNGVLEEVEGDLSQSTKGAVANRLLRNYITVLTDIKNRSNARGSIDVVTNIIQDSTLPAIRQSDKRYRESMYELDPYFQLRRKMEFSIGKSGIGPFALNITNLALTQFAHISIDYGENEFGFGKLDEVIGQDGMRISDWLSAMINAHVDVAKDPYVFDLNINSCTYNMTNFLLRAGKGESTFLFLAQPALKEYADEFNNYGGLYGQNLKYEPEKSSKYALLDQKINEYANRLSSAIKKISNKNTKKAWIESLNKIKGGEYDNWSIVFNTQASKEALRSPQSLKGLQFQLLSLMAFKKITPYAEEMSELVKKSRIDTKKFGNTLALRRDFINEYKKFKNGERDVKWINTDDFTLNPLRKYFESTFLEKKLFASVNMMNDILKHDVVTASEEFDSIVNTIFGEIYGFTTITDELGNKLHPYETVFDKQSVQNMSNELENTFRHKMLFIYGPKIYDQMTGIDSSSDSFDYYQSQKDRGYSGVIDFTFGGDEDVMLDELKRIWNGNSESEDPYEKNSIFENIAEVISILENSDLEDRRGEYKGLVDENGRVINELLNYLRPQPANDKFDIPRLLLKKTNRNTTTSEKSKLMSAFDFMLGHPSETIRRLARDIAIYAYYSGYNTNSAYSFFDLVPVEYRRQYDDAIKEGVENFQSTTLAQVGAENGISDYKENCKPLIDSICRNFYSDDKIVPLFEFPQTFEKNIASYRGTYAGRNIRSKRAKDVISEWFATTSNNKPYLKMETNGETFLYRKTGFYITHEGKNIKYNESGEMVGNKWYVYILTEKLGIHNKNIHQYELFANAWSDSIFDQNRLPSGFSLEHVEQDMYSIMSESQKLLDKAYAKLKNPKKQPKFIDFIPYDNLAVEDSSVRSDVDNSDSNSTIYVKDVNDYIVKHSDAVLSVDNYDQNFIEGLQQFEDLSLGITNTSVENVQQKVSDLITALDSSGLNIDSVYLENDEFGLQFKEVYNNGDYNFINNIYTVSKESPEKTKVVSEKKKDQIKLEQDVINGAQQMDKSLVIQESKSYGNTDAVQDVSNSGPDVINDAPQQIIRGSQKDLKELLRQHNKALKESKKQETIIIPEELKWEEFKYVNGKVNIPNSYEVSSRGDNRFSALNAKFKPKTSITLEGLNGKIILDIGGKTIEYVYQNMVKKSTKGGKPSEDSILYNPNLKTKKQREDFSFLLGYLPLWRKWAEQNPDLLKDLKIKAHGKVLTDMFATKSDVSQARALAQILNESDFTKPTNDDTYNTKC